MAIKEDKSVKCPCCGRLLSPPLWPITRSVPYGKCACSDSSMCLYHRFSDDPMPTRPPEEEMQRRAQLRYDEDCAEFKEKKRILEVMQRMLFVKFLPPEALDRFVEKWNNEVLDYYASCDEECAKEEYSI